LIFNLSAGIGLFGCIVYIIFFDGNEQPWNQDGIEEIPDTDYLVNNDQ
jgi:hypothetical protein